jgi:hypothetical protein
MNQITKEDISRSIRDIPDFPKKLHLKNRKFWVLFQMTCMSTIQLME